MRTIVKRALTAVIGSDDHGSVDEDSIAHVLSYSDVDGIGKFDEANPNLD